MTITGSNPVTVRDLIDDITGHFESADLWYGHGTDNAFDEAVYLVFAGLGLSFDTPDEQLDRQLEPARRDRILQLAELRVTERVPVAYLVNKAWFCGLPFYINESVLIPRSPVAELIEENFHPWVHEDRVKRILDIGTGSACIAIACAAAFPDAVVDAIDISDEALMVARVNVDAYELGDRVRLIKSDLYEALVGNKYDLIIANPPYVDADDMNTLPDEYRHEPRMALAAGEDGLDLVRRIIAGSRRFMNEDAVLIVEVGNSQQAMESAFPDLPLVWLDFERGGEGVFLLTAADLTPSQ